MHITQFTTSSQCPQVTQVLQYLPLLVHDQLWVELIQLQQLLGQDAPHLTGERFQVIEEDSSLQEHCSQLHVHLPAATGNDCLEEYSG